ncbi:MAG: hypothetical protein ACRDKL_04575, partial [Solirubrobacteraceae bacterium]
MQAKHTVHLREAEDRPAKKVDDLGHGWSVTARPAAEKPSLKACRGPAEVPRSKLARPLRNLVHIHQTAELAERVLLPG